MRGYVKGFISCDEFGVPYPCQLEWAIAQFAIANMGPQLPVGFDKQE